MIEINVPGWGIRQIQHLVLDFNGCLACDGQMLPGVKERLAQLSIRLRLHVCTADTFGTVEQQLKTIDTQLTILPQNNQDQQKAELVTSLDPIHCAALGNGRNDVLMLKEAALGIGVIGPEGLWSGLVEACDVLCTQIGPALDLLLYSKRLTATLRR